VSRAVWPCDSDTELVKRLHPDATPSQFGTVMVNVYEPLLFVLVFWMVKPALADVV